MEEETVENRFGFAGEMLDAVTGQYYLRARFYNPAIARFLSEDTYYGDGLNLYAYCHNNPVRYVDPSGHICEKKYQELKKKEAEGGTLSEKERQQIYEYEQNQKKSSGAGSGSKTPSEIAKSWQGTGKYPGIDDYVDVNVKKGTVLYRGEPNGTEYFTTIDAIEQSGRDATKLFEGLQVEKHPLYGYRREMQGYIFNEDVASAYGLTYANPQFGKGGLPQYYVPNVQNLIDKGILTPVDNIKLNKGES